MSVSGNGWVKASDEVCDLNRWFPSKPVRPTVTEITPTTGPRPVAGLPTTSFKNDEVITEWLFACPVVERVGERLATDPNETASELDLQMLRPEMIVSDSWPDVTDAIDLKAVGGEQPKIRSAYCCAVEVEAPTLVRVCHGGAGMNVSAMMWISGQAVEHGGILRLGPGKHPVVIEAYHGHDGTWIKCLMARLAPRFTQVTEDDIEAVHQWEVSRWEASRNGPEPKDEELLSRIEFDPSTIRGKEGFFRVGRSVNGRWWFMDPDGKAFYHKGCTGLNRGGIGGRRVGLDPIEPEGVKQAIKYLDAWGFNGLGSWTTPEFFDKGMPYAETIEAYYVEPWLHLKFPDVFDPEWIANLNAICEELCTPLRESRQLIGYFLDNERSFMELFKPGMRIIPRSPTYRFAGPIPEEGLVLAAEPKLNIEGIGLLQYCLSLDGDRPARRRARAFVLERHGSLAKVGKAWGIKLTDEASIRELTEREELLISEAYQEDLNDFVRLWVEQYYRIFAEAIHRHDPNHLMLGMRHGGTPGPAVLEAESKWADVVSRNNYRAEFYESFDECCRMCDRPVLNGEVAIETDSFRLVRNPIEPPGGYDWQTRGEIRGREAFDRIFSHTGVVGYTKYRWQGNSGDKIWYEGNVNMNVVKPLWLANRRAVRTATQWDRPATNGLPPLHGQVFLQLREGSVVVNELPSPLPGEAPSLHIQQGPICVGLVARDGTWDPIVYGDGIRGQVTAQEGDGNRVRVKFRIKLVPSPFRTSAAEGEYVVDLVRNDTKLEGTFEGTYNGHQTGGRAVGYVYRPVATVSL